MDSKKYESFREYQLDNYDKGLEKKLMSMIEDIPDSNGSRYYNKLNINVAIITDEFMYNYYKDAVNLIYINYFNYKEILESNNIDLFMFVSCWRGVDNNDWRAGNPNGGLQKQRIYDVIDICKSRNIPTVFQSIEDPSNYGSFADIAKRCEYIFTSDKDKIPDYKKYCENEKVYLLEYGVNPLFHNPIGIKVNNKLDDVLFAGSWMGRYAERCVDMKKIFDGILDADRKLNIIDRNFDLGFELYCYPEKYVPYTTKAVNHSDLQKIHKLYNWIINLNSIKHSSTMCAMRIYEAQALGNIILSNYSIAVNTYNPNVFIVNNQSELKSILSTFTDEEIYRHQVYGIRNVMTNQTVYERLMYILDTINMEHEQVKEKSIVVIVKEKSNNIVEVFEKQRYKNKYLIEEKDINNIDIKHDFITFFNEEYEYGEYYIQDMINGFKYTDSNYITKDSYYLDGNIVEGINHNYINQMSDKYRTVFDSNTYSLDHLLGLNKGTYMYNGYSIDCFELNINTPINKYEDNKNFISRLIDSGRKIINKGKLEQTKVEEMNETRKVYDLSVIVPVYNNGKYLLNKCFNSLKRSSMFEDMEIIIVDDGSDDIDTLITIDRIQDEYKNVKVYRYDIGGSNSASRPRNQGIKLATCEYITYLDPDNEAVNDGYVKLYKQIKDSDYDMILGQMLMLNDKEGIVKYSKEREINYPKKDIVDNNFRVNSIQASIIKRSIVIDNDIDMVEGSVGQDTLFFIELMLNSNKVKAVDELIHIYYASVDNSATNKIDRYFFEKSYILEKEMSIRLEKYDLKNIYIEKKLEHFYRYWYMDKLKKISIDDLEHTCNIMIEMLKLYNHENIKDLYIKKFIDYIIEGDYEKVRKDYL